jgi:DNA transposition AAA+ family ATPase
MEKLNFNQKRAVSDAIISWVDESNPARSANKLAEKAGVNPAYVSHIKAGKYTIEKTNTEIKDAYFVRIADAIGLRLDDQLHWDFIENFKRIQRACRKAQKNAIRMVIDGWTGMGKTHALEHFNATNDYVLYIKCTQNMSAKDLLDEMLHKLSVNPDSIRGNHAKLRMLRNIITGRKGYLIIVDEIEVVKAGIYAILKDICDWAHRKAGLIMCGMEIIKKLDKLAEANKPGFPQLRRRVFGNQVLVARRLSSEEILKVCAAEKIINKGAQNLLAQYVTDLDMLAQYVSDIREWQESNGKNITGEEAAELLDIKVTSFKKAA